MPSSAAYSRLSSTNISCCCSASHRLERVSSPPPSYSTRRPVLRTIGNSFGMFFSTAAFCTEKPMLGIRNCHSSGRVGYLATSRSEEHTSELQSLMRISYAVFCLKKKKQHKNTLRH